MLAGPHLQTDSQTAHGGLCWASGGARIPRTRPSLPPGPTQVTASTQSQWPCWGKGEKGLLPHLAAPHTPLASLLYLQSEEEDRGGTEAGREGGPGKGRKSRTNFLLFPCNGSCLALG